MLEHFEYKINVETCSNDEQNVFLKMKQKLNAFVDEDINHY